jgi:hypothetical protein
MIHPELEPKTDETLGCIGDCQPFMLDLSFTYYHIDSLIFLAL